MPPSTPRGRGRGRGRGRHSRDRDRDVPGPGSVLARINEVVTIADFGEDSENEYLAAVDDEPYRVAFHTARRARVRAAATTALAEYENLRTRIRSRLRSRSFQQLIPAVTGAGVGTAKFAPRGSIKPGRKNAVWKFRLDYGPATVKQTTYVIKTFGNEAGRTREDLENEERVQKMFLRRNVIPVPRVFFGLTGRGTRSALAPETPEREQFTVMEDVKGKMITGFEGWSKSKMLTFCKQLAAVRIHLLKYRSTHIGSFEPPPDGTDYIPPVLAVGDCGLHRDRPIPEGNRSSSIRHASTYLRGRDEYRFYNEGPYPTAVQWIDACLQRELRYWNDYDDDELRGSSGILPRRLVQTRANIVALRGYLALRAAENATAQRVKGRARGYVRPTGNYRFCHNDLDRGRNIMVRGAKIVAILDWESSAFLPLSEVLRGLSYEDLHYWGRVRWGTFHAQSHEENTLTPQELRLNSGNYDTAEGPGSDYDSDRDKEGTRMYEDSDGGDYQTTDELRQVPHFHRSRHIAGVKERIDPYDAWDDFITPRVSVYVYTWLRNLVENCVNAQGVCPHPNPEWFVARLAGKNSFLDTFGHAVVTAQNTNIQVVPEEVRMIIEEYPDEAAAPPLVEPAAPAAA